MNRTNWAGGLLFILMIAGCDGDDVGEASLQREGPLMKSDSLVNVLVDLTERLQGTPLTGDRDIDIVTELI